ncbi:hypothetical protein [Bartonella sp. ML70XJBT.G]|uniref:hypothetical protein n=1 Tax=Bartonella sp. ML70XJBT.G TaxID=3019093 RepID=UPI002360191D|nr:hypothetical protein [Bartonella sp. ML70XJBT.G]
MAVPNETALSKFDFEYLFIKKTPPTELNIITTRKNSHGKTLLAHLKTNKKVKLSPPDAGVSYGFILKSQ